MFIVLAVESQAYAEHDCKEENRCANCGKLATLIYQWKCDLPSDAIMTPAIVFGSIEDLDEEIPLGANASAPTFGVEVGVRFAVDVEKPLDAGALSVTNIESEVPPLSELVVLLVREINEVVSLPTLDELVV